MDYSKKTLPKKNTAQAESNHSKNRQKPSGYAGNSTRVVRSNSASKAGYPSSARSKKTTETHNNTDPAATRRIAVKKTAPQRQRTQTNNNQNSYRKPSDLSTASPKTQAKIRQQRNTAEQNHKSTRQRNDAYPGKNARRSAAVRQSQKNIPQFRGPAMAPPPKKRRPISNNLKVLIISLAVVLVCGTGYGWWLITGKLNKDLNDTAYRSIYHISDEAAAMAKDHRIVNIAVFGIDGRKDEDVIGDRSDAMMIVSADFEHGGIKISSIMRDHFSWITDEDYFDKINAAFSLGGAECAVKTINHNFDTALTDYVTINFDCMINMVNAVGGVEVTIEDEDVLNWTNQYIGDVNFNCGTTSPPLSQTGKQVLDGTQALAYCRVRYTGNGDFDRTMRQREVFKQVVLKALDLNPFKQYALLQKVLPYVKTSLSTNEIMKYAANVILMKGRTLSQMQLPASEFCEVGFYGDASCVFPNTLVDNVKTWYRFVYELDFLPSQRTQDLSEEISYMW